MITMTIPRLKTVLLCNGLFAGSSGVICMLFASDLQSLISPALPTWIYTYLGIMLIGFAAFVFFVSRQATPVRALLMMIFAGDLGWILGSIALIILAPDWFSTTGLVIKIALAIVVAEFAWLEYLGLKLLSAGAIKPQSDQSMAGL
ncbi:MAG: hypothetical protein JKY49_14795 [Cohaesibacteraceae bacterium]|nr:hypothetical protein [Cohaesibacteraceae bacterium]